MGKRQRNKKVVAAREEEKPVVGLKLGGWQFRPFQGLDAAFGAQREDYPPMDALPSGHVLRPYEAVVSRIFFNGGTLADYGLAIKKDIDRDQAMIAIRSLLCSWAPKHEHKTAVVAWALSQWCDGTPAAA